ncbi:MAG: M20/M25/M40 family metallo-hydrolase [Phycisphaeraceae bacterium]|nr:MAG: M20/M25/M40 family metallo-hydrolase [Phycisphaeraceae bacterium]
MNHTAARLAALAGLALLPLLGLGTLPPPTAHAPAPSDTRPDDAPAINATAVINGEEVPAPRIPMGDPATIAAIIREGKENSKVMEHLDQLTRKMGPRLTGSARLEEANRWAKAQFEGWGLEARLESWAEIPLRFDRGPSTARVVLRDERTRKVTGEDGIETDETVVEYRPVRDIQFSSPAWSKGTDGPVRGKVVRAPETEEEYEAVKGQLKGAWVLVKAQPAVGQRGVRNRMSTGLESRQRARQRVAEGTPTADIGLPERVIFDGVAGFISTTRDERVWTGAVPGWDRLTLDTVSPDLALAVRLSDYDFINSRLADGEPLEVEVDMKHTFTPGPIPVYNTIAEIRGTEKPDEYVIVSGHLDSWDGPGSQGATDNGTGSSVTIEAARILAAVGAKPKRSILFILWTGEEQGLRGSRGFVRAHEDKLPKISAVFVDDGGTNYQGGLPAADTMVEYLAAATAPVNNVFFSTVDNKYLNVNIRGTGDRINTHGSSDHAPFNAVGVPGFFWDEVGRADYSFGWHTQNDTFELGIPEYLQQSAVCSAITAYNLACAPDLLPRAKPRDENAGGPAAGGGGGGGGGGAQRPRGRREQAE